MLELRVRFGGFRVRGFEPRLWRVRVWGLGFGWLGFTVGGLGFRSGNTGTAMVDRKCQEP